MATFPSVRSGLATALYPFSRRIAFETGKQFFCNATEQSWKTRAPLFEFDWTLNALPAADVNTLLTFHNNRNGMLASDWSLTINGTTWNNLAMQADSFAHEVADLGDIHTVILKAVQTANAGYTIPSVSAVWPTFSSGAKLQIPMSGAWRSLTTQGSSPTGKRYGYGWWGTGVSGQPTRPLRKWECTFVLPDADAVTMENFFLGMQGRLYRDINKIAVSVGLVETA